MCIEIELGGKDSAVAKPLSMCDSDFYSNSLEYFIRTEILEPKAAHYSIYICIHIIMYIYYM